MCVCLQFAAVLREDAAPAAASASQPKQTLVLDLKTALVNVRSFFFYSAHRNDSTVLIRCFSASLQAGDFPDPLTVNPRRPAQSYDVLQDSSFYKALGSSRGEEVRCVSPYYAAEA